MQSAPEPPPGLADWLRRGVAIGLITAHPDDRVRGRVAYRVNPKRSWKTAGPKKLAERVLRDSARVQPERFSIFEDDEGALWFVDETGAASETGE